MLTIERFADVTRLVLSTRFSRAFGYSVSAYVVRDTIIDLGFPAVAREIAAVLQETRPAGAILTHCHEDHAGNIELAARLGIPIAASEATIAELQRGDRLRLERRLLWGTPPRLVTPIRPFEPRGLRLIPTPGHSHDHHIVWDAERETIFAGDLFLGVKVRVAHAEEHPRRLAASVREAAALRPRRLFDAHRGLVPSPVEALLAKADWLEETIGRIEDGIARGWDDRAIARAVLGREEMGYYVSGGGMSRINLVRAVRREPVEPLRRPPPPRTPA
jgi:glyoxylase-like metal-dependent hydrolase (beta-lactamase superfamily II)